MGTSHTCEGFSVVVVMRTRSYRKITIGRKYKTQQHPCKNKFFKQSLHERGL